MRAGTNRGAGSSSNPNQGGFNTGSSEECKSFVDELKREWRVLWRDRIDDKVRAEGIANRDYSLLFVERGTVVVATRDYKPLDFVDILEKHKLPDVENTVPSSPSIGGWGKFIRSVMSMQKRFTRRRGPAPPEPKKVRQLKKGGRGWLHCPPVRE